MAESLRRFIFIGPVIAMACTQPAPKVSPDAAPIVSALPQLLPEQVLIDDPSTCAPCHAAIFEEWNSSLHAIAHASRNPLFAKILELRSTKEGADLATKCAPCHSPRDASGAATSGVSCAACHNVDEVRKESGPGSKALVAGAPRLLRGPHDVAPGASPVHETGSAPEHMKDGSSLCLACHNELRAASGVPVCTTGVEWTADAGSCVQCHMPEVNQPSGLAAKDRQKHRSHRFLGRHRWFQDSPPHKDIEPVKLSGELTGGKLVVTLENLTGHAYPTGFPGRMSVLKVEGRDSTGNVTFTPPDVVLGQVFVDAEGKPTIAPWSVKVASDTRLTPKEARKLELTPGKDVTSVEVKLLARLLPPPLAEKLQLTAAPEGSARVVSRITVTSKSAHP